MAVGMAAARVAEKAEAVGSHPEVPVRGVKAVVTAVAVEEAVRAAVVRVEVVRVAAKEVAAMVAAREAGARAVERAAVEMAAG